jgi:hypothetical protein
MSIEFWVVDNRILLLTPLSRFSELEVEEVEELVWWWVFKKEYVK